MAILSGTPRALAGEAGPGIVMCTPGNLLSGFKSSVYQSRSWITSIPLYCCYKVRAKAPLPLQIVITKMQLSD